jgi:DNA-binding IclR family transcriptional regulator
MEARQSMGRRRSLSGSGSSPSSPPSQRVTAGGRGSVTSRALSVLGTFDAAHTRRTLTEIAAAADLPLSTAHRLVAELVAWQGLARSADGHYEIGRRIWDLGALAAVSRELRAAALPVMQDLSATTGENVHIAVLDGFEALYIDRISGQRSVPVVSQPAVRLPLHTTGVGKILLAHADPDVQQECLRRLTRVTRYTIVEPRRLLRQLADVRERGYATTSEEMTIGACSIAAPVFDTDHRVAAALGLVTSSHHRQLSRLVPTVQLAARSVSRALNPTP